MSAEHAGEGPAPELPENVELAWGRRERPGKGPRRALTLEKIVQAAIEVGAAEGLAAVSMSRVAGAVGVSTMALYRYVPSKADLLTIMHDTLLGPPPEPPAPGTGWREWLLWWARSMREVMRPHAWALRAPLTGPPLLPNSVAWAEIGLQGLRGTGLDDGARISALLLISEFVRSELTVAADLAAAFAKEGQATTSAARGYGPLLLRLINEHRFPELHRIAASGLFEGEDDPDFEFEFGIGRLLDGLAVLADS